MLCLRLWFAYRRMTHHECASRIHSHQFNCKLFWFWQNLCPANNVQLLKKRFKQDTIAHILIILMRFINKRMRFIKMYPHFVVSSRNTNFIVNYRIYNLQSATDLCHYRKSCRKSIFASFLGLFQFFKCIQCVFGILKYELMKYDMIHYGA